MEIEIGSVKREDESGSGRLVRRLVRHRARAAGYIEYGVLAAVAMLVSVGVINFGQQLIRLFEQIGSGLLAIR